LTYDPRNLLAYLRQTREQTVLVALNFGRRPVRLAVGIDLRQRSWRLALSSHHEKLPAFEAGGYLSLAGNEVLILVAET
ncbi:MAG: alpha-glucosidase C-terminal domain-containing protein, partial [Bellilinea sp.]